MAAIVERNISRVFRSGVEQALVNRVLPHYTREAAVRDTGCDLLPAFAGIARPENVWAKIVFLMAVDSRVRRGGVKARRFQHADLRQARQAAGRNIAPRG